jgi:hypothetical protein
MVDCYSVATSFAFFIRGIRGRLVKKCTMIGLWWRCSSSLLKLWISRYDSLTSEVFFCIGSEASGFPQIIVFFGLDLGEPRREDTDHVSIFL